MTSNNGFICRHLGKVLGLTILLGAFGAAPALAQQWEWPEKAENLKVLPEDTPSSQLRGIMFAFNRALGVRCYHCHVGEEGKPFSEFDFASDDKPEKEAARQMMRMTETVNSEYLAELATLDEGAQPLTVNCMTCHRGLARPQPLEDVLIAFLPAHGVDSTLQRYQDLRKQYYGGFAYDFSEPVLVRLAERLLAEQKAAEAVAFLKVNAELHPQSGQTHHMLGEAYAQLGDKPAAIQSLETALAIDPKNQRAQQRLDLLKRE